MVVVGGGGVGVVWCGGGRERRGLCVRARWAVESVWVCVWERGWIPTY